MDLAGATEFDDGPIMAWTTPPFCFPAVAHVRRAAGHDQVVTVTEEHVATGEYETAVFDSRQIDVAAAFELFPIGYDFALDAQPRDAAVWIDFETKMCDALVILDREWVFRVATEWHLREQWYPRHRIAG